MSTLLAGGGNSSARFTHVYSSLAIPFPGSWYACLSLLRHQFLFVARSQTPVHDGMVYIPGVVKSNVQSRNSQSIIDI